MKSERSTYKITPISFHRPVPTCSILHVGYPVLRAFWVPVGIVRGKGQTPPGIREYSCASGGNVCRAEVERIAKNSFFAARRSFLPFLSNLSHRLRGPIEYV